MSWLRTEIEKIVKEVVPYSFTIGILRKLEGGKATVEPVNGDPMLYGVKVKLNTSVQGWEVVPKIGSEVLVGCVNGNEKNLFVAMFSEVEEVKIKGDANGGLTITPNLVAELNKMKARIDQIYTTFSTAVVPAPPPDAGSGIIATMKVAMAAPLPIENFNNVENKKVKHG